MHIRKQPMTTTFADYSAAAEVQESISAAVLKHTLSLCEALRQNYIYYSIRSHQRHVEQYGDIRADLNITKYDYHQSCIEDLKSGKCDYNFYPETGRKYHKIIMDANGSHSVHAFVDKKTGEVYKSASFKAPAKGVRYDLRIIEQREWLFEKADWAGFYLYAK